MRADFWPNLQETLFHQALLPREGRPGRDSLKSLAHVDLAPPSELSAEERPAWSEALMFEGHFKTTAGLDDEMERGNRFLVEMGDRTVLPPGGLPDAWHTALVGASRPYRAHFWLAQQSTDEAYIERQKPLIAAHGAWLSQRLSEIYRTPWPTVPVVVEVVAAVPPFGALSVGDATSGPPQTPLILVSSRDPGYAGDSGLEMLFHEASHLLADKVTELLERTERAQGKRLPWRFWHDVIFYTAGHLVQERLGASYVPYAERPPALLAPRVLAELQTHWQPYLDGKSTLEASVQQLVAAVGEVPPRPPPKLAAPAASTSPTPAPVR
jgi:hypothetical protein